MSCANVAARHPLGFGEDRPRSAAPWGDAMSLEERVAIFGEGGLTSSCSPSERPAGRAQIERWRREKPFERPGLLERKLAAYGISQAEAEEILALPEECFETAGGPPPWREDFEQAYREFGDAPLVFPEDPAAGVDFSSLLIVANPLVAWALNRLRGAMSEVRRADAPDAFSPAAIERAWLGVVRRRLARRIARVAALELGVARLEGRLEGETSQARYRNFFLRLNDPERALGLWREYPVLARHITEDLQTSVAAIREFLAHLTADWHAVEAALARGDRLGPLTDVSLNQGDAHGGGKGVIVARFESGETIVYKPRSLAVEVHFQSLLEWLNRRGAQPAFRTMTILDRDDHGWAEFIAPGACRDDAEVERFYRRQGAYLALFYALQANDFHAQNLIASGEHPMPIDLETLFHASPVRSDTHPIDRLVHRANEDSVMKIGLLPRRVWSRGEADGIDISGIGGGVAQTAPDPTLCWEAPGTDQMRVARDRFTMSGEHNRPLLLDQEVSPARYGETIGAGFAAMYRLLMSRRDELCSPGGPLRAFADSAVRVILRDTRTYAVLLEESFHPDFLRNALDRDLLLDRLWLRTVHQPHLTRAVPAEQRDLRAGDIPLFTTRPDSCDLWTSRGERIERFFEQSGVSAVEERLSRMSEADLSRQLWMIDASLSALDQAPRPAAVSKSPRRDSSQPITSGDLIAAASEVADRLAQLAVQDVDLAIWFGSRYVRERWSTDLVGLDLYDGLSGIALFLAYLGHVSGRPQHTELARRAFAAVERFVEDEGYRPPGVGGFSGLGGLLYATSHLAALWGRPELIGLGESLLARHADLLESDDQHDIVSGAAGCIAGLLSLHAVSGSEASLAAARRCGDRLIEAAQRDGSTASWTASRTAERPLAGFSHGAGGIAHALFQLSLASGEPRYRETAWAAIEFERTLFSPREQNWLDRRDGRSRQHGGESFMTAWCHGAPGIGLSRLAALGHGDDRTVRKEIAAAVSATLRHGFGRNHSLCHGDLGNLELLLEASRRLNDAPLSGQVSAVASGVLNSIRRNGWLCGIPLPIETPGLMNGLAGIGYGLLRLAAPEHIPSVLTMASPPAAYRLQQPAPRRPRVA
jgi:type 2 lantibiotic biosynthesis protein LanM